MSKSIPWSLFALVLAGCASPKAHPIRFGIAAQQSPSQIAAYLARDLGFFAKAGLDVEVEEFSGSSKAMQSLIGGSLDVVSGYHEQVAGLDASAPPIRTFYALTNSQMVALAVSPRAKSKIESVADLRGKTVGVTALGSATHILLNYLLARNRIGPNDVTPVAIGTATRALAAMERGAVEAGVVSDFTVRALERGGPVRILADTRSPQGVRATYGVDRYPGAAVFAKQDWLAAHPDSARKLCRALDEARAWAVTNGADAVLAKLPAGQQGDDPKLYREVVRTAVAMLLPNGRIDPAGAEAASKTVGGAKPPGETYTNEFIP